jgi:hypothetical protein
MGTPPNCTAPGYFCSGNEEFAFFIGPEVPVESSYALYEFPVSSGNCYANPQYNVASTADWANGRSLLGQDHRLVAFSVTAIGTSTEYAIDLKIANTSGGPNQAGDDLLCSPSLPEDGAGGCSPTAADLTDYSLQDIRCKIQVGSQFCDVAELQTEVGSL